MATQRIGLGLLSRTTPLRTQTLRAPSIRNTLQRRSATTASPAAPATEAGFARFWNSSMGPKTVHFWAPVFKWGVVLAGAADFFRPVESLSLSQNAALTATGAIWTRWCFVIRPKNLALASVNFLLFLVGATQVGRVLVYNQSLKKDSIGAEIKDAVKEEGKAIERIVKDPKAALESVKKA